MARCLLFIVCIALCACATTHTPEPGEIEAQAILARLQADIAAMEKNTGQQADRVFLNPQVWARLSVLTHGRPVGNLVGIPVVRSAEVEEWLIVMKQPEWKP